MLNVVLLICWILLAIGFGFASAIKSVKMEKQLVAMRQTGDESLPAPLIRLMPSAK